MRDASQLPPDRLVLIITTVVVHLELLDIRQYELQRQGNTAHATVELQQQLWSFPAYLSQNSFKQILVQTVPCRLFKQEINGSIKLLVLADWGETGFTQCGLTTGASQNLAQVAEGMIALIT